MVVTVAIMGIAVVTILGAIANVMMLTSTHRKQAVAGAAVRAYAEAVETEVAATTTKYTACAGTGVYGTAYTPPAGYTRTVTQVAYLNSTNAFVTTGCTAANDLGVQRVTLKIASSDGKVSETLAIVIRKPCRNITDFPSDTACA